MPPDADDYVRITVKLRRDVETDLSTELSSLGPYYRARRLLALAKLGLLVEKGGLRFDAEKTTMPSPAPLARTTHAAADPGKKKKGKEQIAASPDYSPDLGDLWATGLME